MTDAMLSSQYESDIPTKPNRELVQISHAVIVCFLFSGAIGLVYEVLWIRMLGLVFGHTVFAVTTVLASFMAGLGLGSWLFGKIADRSRRLLAFYGLLEIGIGTYCLILPLLLGRVASLYLWIYRAATLPYFVFSILQFGLVAILLIPPTCLMGATLPVLARFFVREEETIGRQIATLYSVNTLGAVLGALFAGYCLVPILGIRTTLLLAVVMNIGIGSLVLVFERHLKQLSLIGAGDVLPSQSSPERSPAALPWSGCVVAAGFGLSGAASMIYEVTWSRTLTLVIGSSTYAFTAMLAAFLCGIAGGSWAFAALAGRRRVQARTFGMLQLAIGLSALALLPLFGRMPMWFLQVFQFSQAPWFVQGLQFALSFAAMLVPTVFIGATFPCAVRVLTRGISRVGNDTGWIYGVNTAGAIVGSIVAGFVGIPFLGIQATMRIGVWSNLAIGIAVLGIAGGPWLLRGAGLTVATMAVVVCALLPNWNPAVMSSGVAIYGPRYLPLLRAGDFERALRPELVYYRDGISATVSVHRDGPTVFLRVNGKVDASNGADMHTQLFSGHIPMLLHPSPKRVLIIGLGSGVTAGAVAQYPVDHIDIIEIEPAVIEASRFFETENRSVLKDPRVSMIVADGRNFLLNTRVPYDIIISEPSNPWIRGLASLFSQEFFALAQSRLAPGGIMLQWIQGYSISTDDLRMVAATFRTAFPHSTMWFTNVGDNFLVGTKSSLAALLTRVQERFRASPLLREDFTRVGLSNPVGFLADYLLSEEELGRYAVSADLNTDDTLWLEFSAPRSLYELRNAEMNHRVLRSYRTTDLPPMLPADRLVVDTAEGRDALGRALVGKGLAAEAEAQFTRAGGLDPLHVPSRLDEARLLIQHGMAMKALGALEQVLNRNRHEARAHFLKGEAYRQQGLAEQALAAYERAVAEAPENLDYRLRMAEALKAQGAMEKARREYETANHLKPRSVEVLFPLAELCLAQGKPDDALGTLQPLFAAFPKYPLSTRARIQQLAGFAHLRAKRFVEAIQALEAAAALNPLDTGIRLDLAQAYEAAGKPERALTTLDRLLAIDPGHLLALQRFNALRARLEMGQL